MKIMTIVGTRPEIIRLASVIKKLDQFCEHILVHTGQNFDYNLSKVFFEDLDLRAPDIMLDVKADTLYQQLANIIAQTGKVLADVKPDALLVLGDTNSALSVIVAKRMKIPVFHMEAGDRSFDPNVPEELNRALVDHTADINLCYTEHSRRNLIAEGIHASKIYVIGSPIKEVYAEVLPKLAKSTVLERLNLTKNNFFTASIHREENVDRKGGLDMMVETYSALAAKYDMPVIVSTHPRTKKRLEGLGLDKKADKRIVWHEPLGLIDYLQLQTNSFCVVSDSGTIHEDSSVLNFPAVAIRKATEKGESIDAGHCVITGLGAESVLKAVEISVKDPVNLLRSPLPEAYTPENVSGKVVRIVLGMAKLVDEKVWGDPEKKFV
jgi:UDP-N-acetylglucosamine 2-epimerase